MDRAVDDGKDIGKVSDKTGLPIVDVRYLVLVPFPAAARRAAGLRLFSPVCGRGLLPSTCLGPGADGSTLGFLGFLGFLMT